MIGRQLPPLVLVSFALAITGADEAHAQNVQGDTGNGLFAACFAPQQLAKKSGEDRPRRGIRKFDRTPKIGELAEALTIPDGLRGAIRRVKITDGRKLVALTLDLCESTGEVSGYDGAIFDYLRAQKIKATIFVGGKWMRSHGERSQQLVLDPLFEIGNHAEAHRNLRMLSGKYLQREILGPQQSYEAVRSGLLQKQCVKDASDGLVHVPRRMGLFRFPFGACNPVALKAVHDQGLLAIQWDVSTGDPTPGQSARRMVSHVVRRTRPGSIIIAHANGRGHNTAAALPLLISKLKTKGYQFVTVSELLSSGTPEIARTCYDSRPGDTDRYDQFFRQVKARSRRRR